jgi:hypothetical protein
MIHFMGQTEWAGWAVGLKVQDFTTGSRKILWDMAGSKERLKHMADSDGVGMGLLS